jgi:hypothetical protein
MDAMSDIDDGGVEALVSGRGQDTDPRLAEVLSQLRRMYTAAAPTAGPALTAMLATKVPARTRLQRVRLSIAPKVAAGAAIVAATFSGLAVANALPAPLQDAAAHLGIGRTADTHHFAAPSVTTATTTTSTTTTTTGVTHHGSSVTAIAHDHTACPHGSAVAQVASDGRTHNHNPAQETQLGHRPCSQPAHPASEHPGPQTSAVERGNPHEIQNTGGSTNATRGPIKNRDRTDH